MIIIATGQPTIDDILVEGWSQQTILSVAVPIASAVLIIAACTLMTTCLLVFFWRSKRSGKKK